MYSVEITVEKDKVTGETRVLSSTTVLPRERLPQGIKVYEDETKGTRPSPAPPPPRQSLRPSPPSIREPTWRRGQRQAGLGRPILSGACCPGCFPARGPSPSTPISQITHL